MDPARTMTRMSVADVPGAHQGDSLRVPALVRLPGGRLLLRDDHPVFMTIGEDVSDGLRVEQPYFEQTEPLTWDDAGSYVTGPEDGPVVSHGVNHQWNHSVGEILTSLLGAGLVLDSFEETRHAAWCPWPDLMVLDEQGWRLRENPERLPLQFVLTAHRPA